MVGEIGFEPINPNENRFTACRASPSAPLTHIIEQYWLNKIVYLNSHLHKTIIFPVLFNSNPKTTTIWCASFSKFRFWKRGLDSNQLSPDYKSGEFPNILPHYIKLQVIIIINYSLLVREYQIWEPSATTAAPRQENNPVYVVLTILHLTNSVIGFINDWV